MIADRNLYILCGGKSRRMGVDKALLSLDGSTFLERLRILGKPYFKDIALLSAAKAYSLEYRHLEDAVPGSGPLGGLLKAFQDAGSDEYIAVIPVDLPFISSQTMEHLARALPDKGIQALVARSGEIIQPLAGIYSTSLAGQLSDYLAHGDRRVMGFLNQVQHTFFNVNPKEITNINSPDDLPDLS